jgi:hypothetical protein
VVPWMLALARSVAALNVDRAVLSRLAPFCNTPRRLNALIMRSA